MSTLYGSLAAPNGAATAPAVSTSRISAPTTATRWRRNRCHTPGRRLTDSPVSAMSGIFDARVNHCIDHVCQHVAEQDRHRADQIDRHDDGVVAPLHGRQGEGSEA